jgi:hypothetical protein
MEDCQKDEWERDAHSFNKPADSAMPLSRSSSPIERGLKQSRPNRLMDHALQGIIRIPGLILSAQEFSHCPWIRPSKGDGKIEVMRSTPQAATANPPINAK